MPTVHLRDRALIAVEGADAETFLQNIVTTDLAALGDGEARPARCCRRKARSCSISWSRAPATSTSCSTAAPRSPTISCAG